MEQSALDRKAKLEALKQRANRKRALQQESDSNDPAEDKKPLRFRNYDPVHSQLKEYIADAPLVGPEAKGVVDTVEGQVGTMNGLIAKQFN